MALNPFPGRRVSSGWRSRSSMAVRRGPTEVIAYGMPTFDLGDKHVLHLAGFAKHAALYPVPDWLEAFGDEVTPYKSGQGTLNFPLDKPLPADLIRRIVEFSVACSGAGSD